MFKSFHSVVRFVSSVRGRVGHLDGVEFSFGDVRLGLMKVLVSIALVLISSLTFGQTSFLKDAVVKLDKALIAKDTVVMKQLLHKDLTYGHSNGWVETKADVIKDLASCKLAYNKIESKDVKWTVTNDVSTIRSTSEISYQLDGKPGELRLHVLQVWLKTNKGWQLLSRQSTKL